jgi:uncharacterized protein (TIGR02246 family)
MEQTSTLLKSKLDEKAAIRKLIDEYMAALCNKDVKSMMTHYASDVIVYDVKPPFQIKGAVTWKHAWEACIGYFPESFKIELKDVKIYAGPDVAMAHYLMRLTGKEKDHPAMKTWIRISTGWKKQQGRWKIVHEHGSLPYNPHTMQATATLETSQTISESMDSGCSLNDSIATETRSKSENKK